MSDITFISFLLKTLFACLRTKGWTFSSHLFPKAAVHAEGFRVNKHSPAQIFSDFETYRWDGSCSILGELKLDYVRNSLSLHKQVMWVS